MARELTVRQAATSRSSLPRSFVMWTLAHGIQRKGLQYAAWRGDLTARLTIDPASFQAMDQQLVRAIEELPQEYQTVLLLWALEDFSYKEIADAIEAPIGTVMSRLHRARARLSARLADFARNEGIIRE